MNNDRLLKSPLVPVALLAGILLVFFWRCLLPGWVHFSNDGPLGVINAEWIQLPGTMFAAWNDLNSIGIKGGVFPPCITSIVRWISGPVGYAKFLAPISLIIVGIAAWFCFKRLGLTAAACVIGAVAAAINADFFSTACWGVASQVITFAMAFIAVALVVSNKPSHPLGLRIVRLAIAGAAVGMGVMEGADIGAIFSIFVAAFVLFHHLAQPSTEKLTKRLFQGVVNVSIIAICAAIVASHAIYSLVQTSIKGVAIITKEDPVQKWDWATQWSLPKTETLGLIIPGLFGYRMDTPEGGMYWGAVGRDPNWDRYFAGQITTPPPGFLRYTGGGNYLGSVLWLTALWAIARALRKNHPSPLPPYTRRFILFWGAVALLSLLFAYGRHAPFYTIVYSLPYFSTIRNPTKFLHVFTWAMLFLSTFGIHDLLTRYTSRESSSSTNIATLIKNLKGFEARWAILVAGLVSLFLLGFLIYLSATQDLVSYLTSEKGQFDETTAKEIAKFSQTQYLWFMIFLLPTAFVLVLASGGYFSGKRARLLSPLLLILMCAELGRANTHWTVFWYYPDKYALDPIVDFLRDKPYKGRVAIYPFPAPASQSLINGYYTIEWAQHQFQYYNVQSIDIVQMPRMPEDLRAYEMALAFDGTSASLYKIARRWMLTNTRYIIAPTRTRLPFGELPTIEFLNTWVANDSNAFKPILYFDLIPKSGITQITRFDQLRPIVTTNGPFALIEFTKALPRAKLFSTWTVITNDQEVLDLLSSTNFNPAEKVLVSTPIAPSDSTNSITDETAHVEFTSYHPRHIQLKVSTTLPSVLLLNDKFDPDWKVYVDGQPKELLRCNFIMRGVQVPPGQHTVSFEYKPARTPFFVTASALTIALLLIGICMALEHKHKPVPPPIT